MCHQKWQNLTFCRPVNPSLGHVTDDSCLKSAFLELQQTLWVSIFNKFRVSGTLFQKLWLSL